MLSQRLISYIHISITHKYIESSFTSAFCKARMAQTVSLLPWLSAVIKTEFSLPVHSYSLYQGDTGVDITDTLSPFLQIEKKLDLTG